MREQHCTIPNGENVAADLPARSDRTKLIFTFLLNRVNTITGRRYGDDPSILAWETGNELQHNFKGNLPAPGDWTGESA